MKTIWTGTWQGGRTRWGKDGRTVWVVEKMVKRVSYRFTLEVETEAQALAELALFLRDPEAYRTAKTARLEATEAEAKAQSEAVLLDAKAIEDFSKHLESQGRSDRYVKNVEAYLITWAKALKGRDLRYLKLLDLTKALDGSNAAYTRAMALKSFCSWLQRRGVLEHGQNVSAALKVDQPRTAKAIEERAYPTDLVEAIYARIPTAPVRDALRVRAATGMHFSEIVRVAQGQAKIVRLKDQGEIAATVRFDHKRGNAHTVSVDAPTLAAILRLCAAGDAPSERWIHTQLERAAGQLAVETGKAVDKLQPGRLRHSFITWAVTGGSLVASKGGGISLADAARAAGHTSPEITAIRYLGEVIPPLTKLPLNLSHPDDLPLLEAA